jgi:NADP-dependent 3-hydroxy acid dehydrogenase YdfG
MAGRSLARLEAAAADIRAALLTKVDLQCMLLDVGSLQSIKEFVAQFTVRRLPLHFLINNAGAWREWVAKEMGGLSIFDWQACMRAA